MMCENHTTFQGLLRHSLRPRVALESVILWHPVILCCVIPVPFVMSGRRGDIAIWHSWQRRLPQKKLPTFPCSPEVLALKHESRIRGQSSNPVCGSRNSVASSPWAKQHESNLFHHVETAYRFGWMSKILLSHFRAKDSGVRPSRRVGFDHIAKISDGEKLPSGLR